MRFLAQLIFSLFFVATLFAQNDYGFKQMMDEAKNIVFTNPEESIKIANHILENSTDSDQQIDAHLLNAAAYYVYGQYEKAINSSLQAKKLAESTGNEVMQLKASVAATHLLYHLGMDVVAQEYLTRTRQQIASLKEAESRPYIIAGTSLVAAYKKMAQEEWSDALKTISRSDSVFSNSQNKIFETENTTLKAEIFLKAFPSDSAETLLKSIADKSEVTPQNNFLKMVAHTELGKLYFLKKDYRKSIETYQIALEISEQLHNNMYGSQIAEGLSTSYLALDDTQNFYVNKIKADQWANAAETDERQAVNAVYNYINSNHTAMGERVKYVYVRNISILASLLFLIALIWIGLRFRYRKRARQYEDFLNYFENRQKPKETESIKEVPKSLNIPRETERAIVHKLKQFESSKHFTRQDMSLAQLASHFDTNTKYLSEIINTHKLQNFNSYINELRINFIIDKLKNNPTYLQYKISYLAEESGFSTHSSFATVFKNITGIPPTTFIDMLREQNKSSKSKHREYGEV